MKAKIAKGDLVEIKSLAAPPAAVKTVLSVTMLLLGNEEHVAKSYSHWKKQSLTVLPRTSQVNVDLIPVEVAQLARQWLGDLTQEAIKCKSSAAVSFFNWNQEVIESVLARSG